MKKLRGLMALVLAAAMALGTGGVGVMTARAEETVSITVNRNNDSYYTQLTVADDFKEGITYYKKTGNAYDADDDVNEDNFKTKVANGLYVAHGAGSNDETYYAFKIFDVTKTGTGKGDASDQSIQEQSAEAVYTPLADDAEFSKSVTYYKTSEDNNDGHVQVSIDDADEFATEKSNLYTKSISASTNVDSGVAYFLEDNDTNPWKAITDGTKYPNIHKYLKFTYTANKSGWAVEWQDNMDYTEENAKALADELWAAITKPTAQSSDYTIAEAKLTENVDYYKLTDPNNSGSYTKNDVKPGYYLIQSSLGSNLALVTTNVTITEKNSYPSVKKEVMDATATGTVITQGQVTPTPEAKPETDAKIGDIVTFKLTVTVPAGVDKVIKLQDTMSAGLTLVYDSFMIESSNSKLSYNDSNNYFDIQHSNSLTPSPVLKNTLSTKKTYDTADYYTSKQSAATMASSFEIATTQTYLNALGDESDTITITYDAVLNENARTTRDSSDVEENNNKVKLTYSNYTSEDGETKIHSYDFDLVKYYKDSADSDKQKLLAGAKFNLYYADAVETDGKTLKSNANPIKFTFDAGSQTYTVSEGNSATEDITSVDTKAMKIRGLDAATYYLVEKEAPAGYNRVDEPIPVTINRTTNTTGEITSATVTTVKSAHIEEHVKNKIDATITGGTGTTKEYSSGGVAVLNNAGVELPSTGGIGTTIFYVVGGILVLGAGVLLITKRRVRGK